MSAQPAESLAFELRHNDEALGRVFAGAVEIDHDAPQAEVRFWMGLRAIRAQVSVCKLVPFDRELYAANILNAALLTLGTASGVALARDLLPRIRRDLVSLIVG